MNGEHGDFHLQPIGFDALPGWKDDDPSSLFDVMTACYHYITHVKPYRTGSLGLSTDDLRPLLRDAADFRPASPMEARAFFEHRCQPFRIALSPHKTGFVTGFYEPEVLVCDQPDDRFRFPFYKRPDDLIDIHDTNRPLTLDSSYAFARYSQGEIQPYPDRKAIDQGYLAGRNLEIAWAESKIDVFFAHIQGAARLRYRDGRLKRITYAAKAGHAFSPIGQYLVDQGEIDPHSISMQSIRKWLAMHPERADDVLWRNRSYIFFGETDTDPQTGPVAAAKVPLLAGRSLAVDRLIHTFGFPFFVHSQSLQHLNNNKPFQRLMLALDTGSAIVGPARGDIFTGSGEHAGELAGTVRNQADMYILIPHTAAARFC